MGTLGETVVREVQPLGDQIIIRTIPQESVGSIVVPDSAKRISHQGADGQVVHSVEADVLAVGNGKRLNGDKALVAELVDVIRDFQDGEWIPRERIHELFQRAENGHHRATLQVKPGDRVIFHPAVQSFDRDITDLLSDGTEPLGTRYYLISEERSALAIIERETA